MEGVEISIDDRELQKAIRDIKAHETEKLKRVTKVVQETTLNIDRKAKKFAPVLTGRLRASIRPRFSRDMRSGQVYTDVEYAPFVEFGTTKQRKQPFMRPAALLEQRSYISKMRQALK